ncbi:MAG: hypothetical protein KTR30_22620 [Saprospiraceae bacterium]|nr:hypothetical protein [Saprospiraceae bacterium]
MRTAILCFVMFGLLGVFSACNTSKANSTGNCDMQAEVKDFSQLDGCGLLIVAPDGKKLSPVNWDQWSAIAKADLKINISYKEVEPRMSICMSESGFIEITCASIIK